MINVMKKYQVFVSSTYEDLREERNIVVQSLLEGDCIPTGMELFSASNKSSWELIETIIKESDIYVLIIGGRYGSLCDDDRSFTEREYDLAQEANMTTLAFLPKNIHYDAIESNEMHARLDKFIEKIKYKKQASFYDDIMELRANVLAAVGKASKSMPSHAGWIRQISSNSLDFSINLPSKFAIFISGATGVGKSTIARRLMAKVPRLMVLEESDLTREDIRATLQECVNRVTQFLRKTESKPGEPKHSRSDVEQLLDFDIANNSTKNLSIANIEKQCQWLTPAMKNKCERLNRLRIPAVFEGVGISFKVMSSNDYFSSLINSKNALFINLHLSNDDVHKRRLRERCEDRGEPFSMIEGKFKHIKSVRTSLYRQTETMSTKCKNVINIDALGSIDTTVRLIIEAIERL